MQACMRCGGEKLAADFYLRRGKPRPECKLCTRAASKANRRANPERERARGSERTRQRREASPPKQPRGPARTNADRYRDNPEQYRQASRDRYQRRVAKDPEAMRRYWREQYHLRVARRCRDTADYLAALRLDPCAYCGEHGGEIDHIEPVASGGEDHADNFIGACRSCNASKQDVPLLLFLNRKAVT